MGSGYRNIFVRFEYCASPLCPFELLPSPKIEENQCGANYPTAHYPYPPARLQRAGSIPRVVDKPPQSLSARCRAPIWRRVIAQPLL